MFDSVPLLPPGCPAWGVSLSEARLWEVLQKTLKKDEKL